LLITPARAQSVPKLVIAIGRRCVQYINSSGRSTGILWDSLYKSSLVGSEADLLRCQQQTSVWRPSRG